jgi:hypothetical protein
MTSERMIASNRSNGRRGLGPRTAAGKASSRRNALRHGLAASLLDEPAMCAKVAALARAIAGAGADTARLNQARIIAGAQIDLARIREAKVRIMNSHPLDASALEGEFPEMNPHRIRRPMKRVGRAAMSWAATRAPEKRPRRRRLISCGNS